MTVQQLTADYEAKRAEVDNFTAELLHAKLTLDVSITVLRLCIYIYYYYNFYYFFILLCLGRS